MSTTLLQGLLVNVDRFTTRFGERLKLVVDLTDRREILWLPPDHPVGDLHPGDPVVLVQDPKGRLKPVVPTHPETKPPALPAPNQVQAQDRVTELVGLMARCYRELAHQLPEVPPEQLQAMASTVFITLTRS